MKKLITLLFAALMSVSMFANNFGILVNGQRFVQAEYYEYTDSGFSIYLAHVKVNAGDYCQFYDEDNQAAWVAPIMDGSVAGITYSGNSYDVSVSGCYDFYMYIKYADDRLYVTSSSDCPATTMYLWEVANYIDFQALSESDYYMTSSSITSTSPYTLSNGTVIRGFLKPDGTESQITWTVKDGYSTTLPTPEWSGVDYLKVGTSLRAASHTTIELGAISASHISIYFQPNGDGERGVALHVLGDSIGECRKSGLKIDGIRPAYVAEFDIPAGNYNAGDIVIELLTNTSNIFGVGYVEYNPVVSTEDVDFAYTATSISNWYPGQYAVLNESYSDEYLNKYVYDYTDGYGEYNEAYMYAKPHIRFKYKNSSDKLRAFTISPGNYYEFGGKSGIIEIQDTKAGDRIKITVAAKGSSDASFADQTGAYPSNAVAISSDLTLPAKDIDAYDSDENGYRWRELEFQSLGGDVELKEVNCGFRIKRVEIVKQVPVAYDWYWKGYVDGADIDVPTYENLFQNGISQITVQNDAYLFVLRCLAGQVIGESYMSYSYTEETHATMYNNTNNYNAVQKIHIPAGTWTLYLYDNGDGSVELSREVIPGKTLMDGGVNPYTVTANAYPSYAGYVDVTYNSDHTQATMTAVPYSGYHFSYWNDGNTSNPRTVVLTSDVTYTAYFEQDYIDPSQGRVWPILMDDVTYAQKQQYVVSDFRPNDEDQFLYVWDGTYVGGTTTGLNFYGNTEGYLALTVNNMGWSGAGFNMSGASIQPVEALRQEMAANPSDYYLHFAIKSTDNYSHCFYFMGAENVGAKFVIGSQSVYDCPVYADFERDGAWHEFYIPMSQYADALSAQMIQDNVNIFVFLSEGVQGAQLNLDAVYFCNTAYKDAQTTPAETYNVTAYASPSYAGYVDVTYTADHKSALLTATPYSGYHFTAWSDGMTVNPRTLTLTKDVTITAYFEQDQVIPKETNLTVNSADLAMGSAYGTGVYLTGTYQQIFAIPQPGYYFTQWSDGNAENPRQLYLSEQEMTLTANFEIVSTVTYSVDVASSDPTRGTTEVEQYVRIEAIPAEGCEFVAWSDGDTSNPRFVKLDRDIMLRAIFSGTPHGYDNVPVNPNAQVHKIIVNDQVFIIRGDQTFTITGQVVK